MPRKFGISQSICLAMLEWEPLDSCEIADIGDSNMKHACFKAQVDVQSKVTHL